MDINLPFLAHYPKDDSKFIDPMFVPYQRKNIPLDNQGCYIPVNTWSSMGNPNYVNNDHYRREWNMDFKKMYASDPCPGGWKDAGNGICVAVRQEAHDSNFYADKMFKVKYQYPNGYTVNNKNGPCVALNDQDDSPAVKAASLNPNTGRFVVYHDPNPNKNSKKYGGLPSRSSYLGH